MPILEFDGKIYEVDEHGHLHDWQQWNEELAGHMAKLDGLELTETHLEIIRFLRDYFHKYQTTPMVKILVKEVVKVFGPEKGNIKYLSKLFSELCPAAPTKQACRYAGLPGPTG